MNEKISMNEKVYIVTGGIYDDYAIDSVFSTKGKAEDYVKLRNQQLRENNNYFNSREWYIVEEFELDKK